jgi:pimeloyl-ACP methyl ester carboxylesterase
MSTHRKIAIAVALVAAGTMISSPITAAAEPGTKISTMSSTPSETGVRTVTGTLPDGSHYLFEVPRRWNGTLLLYAHGYNVGPDNPAQNHSPDDDQLRSALLARGYALAGQSYPDVGWQVTTGVDGQVATLSRFSAEIARPQTVIAWGESMGGQITNLLAERRPDVIDGAVAMCPVVAGTTSWLNTYLDGAYTMKTLLAPGSDLPLIGIENPGAATAAWAQLATAAQETAQGRARLALAAAFAALPGWSDAGSSEPASGDFAARELNQFHTLSSSLPAFQAAVRADMENRVGGAFSWNTGVDYKALFDDLDPVARQEVDALYAGSGADLAADLAALDAGPRVRGNPTAIAQMNSYAPAGRLDVPLLTMHTTGDNIVSPGVEPIYRKTVADAGRSAQLRQTWVQAPGHCAFSTSERVTALETMVTRIQTGRWPQTTPAALNSRASATRLDTSRFTAYEPRSLPRPQLYPRND